MNEIAALAGQLGARNPIRIGRWKVLLPEMRSVAIDSEALRQALQRGRSIAQKRQQARGDALVERKDFALGDSRIRIHDLVEIREGRCFLGWPRRAPWSGRLRGEGSPRRCWFRLWFVSRGAVGIWLRPREFVFHLDEKPVVFAPSLAAHADQYKAAL